MMIPLWIVPGAVFLMLTACQTTSSDVNVRQIEGAPEQCRSMGWGPASGEPLSITDQRIRQQVSEVMKAKGYAEETDTPACLISVQFISRDTVVSPSGPRVGIGAGGGSGGVGGGVGISLPLGQKKTHSGTVSLQVIDAAAAKEVWNASVDGKFESYSMTESETRAIVARILETFPERRKL